MQHNRLLNLLAANKKRGEFKAEANTIYLYDTIVSSKADAEWFGGVDAETFVQTLRGMTGDVSLRINSPGGDVFAARAMAQAIKDHAGTVTAYVDGYAASAASFITSAADRVVMSDGSMLMIHKAWTLGFGNADDLLATADLLAKIDGTIAGTYEASATRRGKSTTMDEFAAMMADETWLTGQEAIDAGMADEIAQDGPKDMSRWDVSAYSKAPEAIVIAPPANEITQEMTARQAKLYEAVESVAEDLGAFDQTSGANGAHYMTENPFAAQGIKCANCAFYAGPRACEVVSGDIDPEAACKLWIIPENLMAEPSNQIEQRPNLAMDLLLRPSA